MGQTLNQPICCLLSPWPVLGQGHRWTEDNANPGHCGGVCETTGAGGRAVGEAHFVWPPFLYGFGERV